MRYALLALMLVAGSDLMAQEVRINGGAHIGMASPTGDFATKENAFGDYLGANNGLGLHVGGHLDFNFTRHHQLRFHLTVHGFASEEQDLVDSDGFSDGTLQNGFGVAQFGGDYVFNLGTPSKGAYFLAGLSLNRVTATTKYSYYPDWEATQSGRAGIRVGAGYTFNRVFSLEGQLNSVSVEAGGREGFGFDALTWMSFTAVFRFGRP